MNTEKRQVWSKLKNYCVKHEQTNKWNVMEWFIWIIDSKEPQIKIFYAVQEWTKSLELCQLSWRAMNHEKMISQTWKNNNNKKFLSQDLLVFKVRTVVFMFCFVKVLLLVIFALIHFYIWKKKRLFNAGVQKIFRP